MQDLNLTVKETTFSFLFPMLIQPWKKAHDISGAYHNRKLQRSYKSSIKKSFCFCPPPPPPPSNLHFVSDLVNILTINTPHQVWTRLNWDFIKVYESVDKVQYRLIKVWHILLTWCLKTKQTKCCHRLTILCSAHSHSTSCESSVCAQQNNALM